MSIDLAFASQMMGPLFLFSYSHFHQQTNYVYTVFPNFHPKRKEATSHIKAKLFFFYFAHNAMAVVLCKDPPPSIYQSLESFVFASLKKVNIVVRGT